MSQGRGTKIPLHPFFPAPNEARSFQMIGTTLALIIFLFPLAYSPGPGNMFFAANGARFGFAATLRANIGYHIATWLVTVVIGFGIITALNDSPKIFLALKAAGAVYVFWLAGKLIQAGIYDGQVEPKPATFWDGAVLMVLNPKAYVIIALMFSQFLPTDGGLHVAAVLTISTIFTINNLAAFSIWAAVGGKMADHFRTEAGARRLNILFGGILAAVAVWMLFS